MSKTDMSTLVRVEHGSIFHVRRKDVQAFRTEGRHEYPEKMKRNVVNFYNARGEYLAYGDARNFVSPTAIV